MGMKSISSGAGDPSPWAGRLCGRRYLRKRNQLWAIMSLVGALVLGGGAQAGNNPIDAEVNLNCNTPANIGVLTRSFEKIKVNVNWSPGTEVLFKFTDKDCQGNSNCQIEVTESTGTGT